MNAITYFKFKSPFDGDVTKNCALTGLEVDNNFYTLEGRDIQSVELEDGKIVINLMNGEKLSTENITEGCLRDLAVSFDEHNGVLKITRNGVTEEIGGFVTHYNQNEAIATDGSLIGKGLVNSPSGISPVYKTGQYRPVKRIIDITNDETLPKRGEVLPGDRFLTIENVNEYGYLYNYEGVKKIACRLAETHSEWRIPTKEDWDDMLNAIEPNERFKNHNDTRSNKFLGKFAGKLLKTPKCWEEEEDEECCDCHDTEIIEEECNCGESTICHPDYCGEYGTCHHKHKIDNSGIDKYCFSVVPAGYANEAKDFLYFKERAYFWTATNHEYRDAYIKAFAYNKSSVLQDILAGDNYLSLRLVKDYTGDNFNERDNILGGSYSTVLMPSVKNGQAIWTSVNIGLIDCECDCHCKYVLPNDGQDMNFIKKYFTNEWNGKEWIKKELADGESVVVINLKKENNGQDDTSDDTDNNVNTSCGCHNDVPEDKDYEAKYIEYRVVKGELVNVADIIYDKVIEKIESDFDGIDGSIEEINNKLEQEITRSTQRDEELQTSINDLNSHIQQTDANIATVNENLVNSVNSINENVANGFNTINNNVANAVTTINEAIEAERQLRNEKDAELEEKLNAEKQEREAKDTELEEKLNTEKQERETKDTELEDKINEIGGDFEDLSGKLLTQEGTVYNAENGILTLKSRDGSNDVEVKFNFNFGTF